MPLIGVNMEWQLEE